VVKRVVNIVYTVRADAYWSSRASRHVVAGARRLLRPRALIPYSLLAIFAVPRLLASRTFRAPVLFPEFRRLVYLVRRGAGRRAELCATAGIILLCRQIWKLKR